MKKYLLLAVAAVCAVATQAKVWRVNPNEAAKADFLSLTEATASEDVAKFDTLYCEPGVYQGQNTISKPCTILGPGWGFRATNGSTAAAEAAQFANRIYLSADSIYIAGLMVREFYADDGKTYKGITIERNMIGQFDTWYGGGWINLNIRDNYFDSRFNSSGECFIGFSSSTTVLQNVSIENNILNYTGMYYNSAIVADAGVSGSVLIAHNTIKGNFSLNSNAPAFKTSYAIIRDNIIIGGTSMFNFSQMSVNQFYNNVLSLTPEDVSAEDFAQYGETNYFIGATLENTFLCEGTNDAYFRLSETSVAKNKAYQGEDCGAFAGGWPYVINARPAGMPYIYDANVPNYPTGNQLNITFKVKANNQ